QSGSTGLRICAGGVGYRCCRINHTFRRRLALELGYDSRPVRVPDKSGERQWFAFEVFAALQYFGRHGYLSLLNQFSLKRDDSFEYVHLPLVNSEPQSISGKWQVLCPTQAPRAPFL